MIQSQSAPFILILSIVLLVLSGVMTLVWGRRFPRNGDWVVGLFLTVLAGALIFSGNGIIEDGVRSHAWLRGWIWPVELEGALSAGVLQDALGHVLAGLGVVFASILLLGGQLLSGQPRPERIYSGIAFAAAGCALSWIALTPWFALVGLLLVIFGGFISLGSQWELEGESALAIRFGRERSFGVIFAVLGACGLAGEHAPLIWSKTPWFTETQGLTLSEAAGAALLIAGLLLQLQPFPLLTWVVTPGKTAPWIRAALTQVFPAWAAFGILLRLQANFGAPIFFTVFGWIMFASTVLAVISGVLQTEWKSALGAWISAGASLAATMLCFGSPEAALSLMIGLGLGATAFACAQTSLQSPQKGEAARSSTIPWAKTMGFLGMSAAIGVLGFVSAGGIVDWLSRSWKDPAQAAASLSGFALFAMLGWKLSWTMIRQKVTHALHWSTIVLPAFLVLFALGIIWTGSATGGALPAGVDRVTSSLMERLFEAHPNGTEEAATVLGAYLGVLLVSFGAAYWASIQVRAPEEEGVSKKVFLFIVSGYGMDRMANRVLRGLIWLSRQTETLIEKRIWGEWVPAGFSMAIRSTANAIIRADTAVSVFGRRVMRQGIDSPAKFLQLIQNGDVQWYLLLGVGSGLAILVHFLLGAGVPH